MIYLVPMHLLWIRRCKGSKKGSAENHGTAIGCQYSTPLNSKLPTRADQPHRSKQMEQRDSPDRVTVTAISFLQYMFGHAIQFWGYLPLYFIPSLPIHDTRSEFQGSIYSIHAWLVSLLIKMFKWREIILQHPVSSSTRVQPMEPPNGRNIYPDMRHGFYAIVLHSCHNFIPYACMNQYA